MIGLSETGAQLDPIRKKRLARDLEPALVVTSIFLGLVHTWAGRYSMSVDGISYLDVGAAFFRRDWFGAFNAYWSPAYAWIQGLIVGLLKPSIRWEFPVEHLVNFGIFLVTLLAFRFLVHACLDYRRLSPLLDEDSENLHDWIVTLLAYTVFWWVTFELMPLYEIGPDLALSGCLYMAVGLLLRARLSLRSRDFLLLGAALGTGYWFKAPFFPVAIVFLGLAYVWGRHTVGWSSKLGLALLAFALTSAPLVIALSVQKHRPTFGDSGRLNYAWFIAPQTFHRNWQGEEPGSGTPLHPTQKILPDPPVYTFDGPLKGSYPPWLDPSYWNEGLRPHFSLKPQLNALMTNLMTEASLVLRAQPALLVGVLVLGLLSGGGWLLGLREIWPLLGVSAFAFAMYAPVHVEPRFLGGFVLLLFLALVLGARLQKNDARAAAYLALAIFAVMTVGTVDTALRFATLHLAIPGNGPAPALTDITVAQQLRQMGLAPGDRVAVIGDGTGAYWARLARLRIVAEVMAANHDAQRFWKGSETVQRSVIEAFAASCVRMVVTNTAPADPGGSWIHLKDTAIYVLPLDPNAVCAPPVNVLRTEPAHGLPLAREVDH